MINLTKEQKIWRERGTKGTLKTEIAGFRRDKTNREGEEEMT